jgi:hypothetical protein
VPEQVHENIDVILADGRRNFIVGCARDMAPVIGESGNPAAQVVLVFPDMITNDRKTLTVPVFEHGQEIVANHMLSQVGRKVSDFKEALRIGRVLEFRVWRIMGAGELPLPVAHFRFMRFGGHVRFVIQAGEQGRKRMELVRRRLHA